MKTNRVSEIRPVATASTARLAEVLAALLAREPELAEKLLETYRAQKEAPSAPSAVMLPVLESPALVAAEADVEAAKDLLGRAIAHRSEVLKGIQAAQGPGPYLTPAGKAQIVSRTSSKGVTWFLRVAKG